MLKNLSSLEHKIGDRVFQILCQSDSPLNEVKDALFEFLKYIGKVEDTIKAQQESVKVNEPELPLDNLEKSVEELQADMVS